MKNSYELRPYQIDGINRIIESWKAGNKSVLFQMPTGTGKTILFSEIVRRGNSQNKRILIVAHRRELIEQTLRKLNEKGVECGIILSGEQPDYSKNVQIASIQTLSKREIIANVNLVIIDECHHAKADSYLSLWDMFPEAKFLGVTATPKRLDSKGFDDIFNDLIVSPGIKDFIAEGYLSPIRQLVCQMPQLEGVKVTQGDYATVQLRGIMSTSEMMADLIDSYTKHAFGKQTIVFGVDVEHSLAIAAKYNNAGILAEHIDGNTPKRLRDEILTMFKNKEIQVVSNVDIISEGYDFPGCDAVQLARPTKSLVLYLQQAGRCMRPSLDKTHGIILDHAGLWKEHGLVTIDRVWSLFNEKELWANLSVAAISKEGIYSPVNRPIEALGLEMVELTEEIERLLEFESYLSSCQITNNKPLWAYYKYKRSLLNQGIVMSLDEYDYCARRIKPLNDPPKEAF